MSRLVGDTVARPELAIEHRTVAEAGEVGMGREELRLPAAAP